MTDEENRASLARRIAREASEMFGHLPEEEITQDEPLEFTMYLGRLAVYVPRNDTTYTIRGGATWAYRLDPTTGLVELRVYIERRLVESKLADLKHRPRTVPRSAPN